MKKKNAVKPVTLRQVDDLLKANKSSITQAPIIHDIVTRINNYIEDEKRPLYVYCHTTGKKCGMTAIAYFQKKLAQYGGDIVKLFTEYRGRGVGGPNAAAPNTPRLNRKGNYFKIAASHNPFKTVGEWMIKSDKKGNPLVSRREVIMLDGTKTYKDFDHLTEEYTPVKNPKKQTV